jgi:hypothetical protein
MWCQITDDSGNSQQVRYAPIAGNSGHAFAPGQSTRNDNGMDLALSRFSAPPLTLILTIHDPAMVQILETRE